MKSMLLTVLCMLLLSGCGYNGTPTRSPEGIIPLTSIEITPVSSKIAAGTSTKLTARGFYSGVPSDITDQVVWTSSDETVAKFNFTTSPNKNRVSGISAGTAVVTATVGNVSATYTLQVTNATVTGMTISTVPPTVPPATPTVLKGSTKQLAVTGTFSDSTTQDLTFDTTWSSSPGTFATVSNDPASKGLATATAKGVETITATFIFDTTKFTTSTLTVIELQSIAVTPADPTIAGFTKTLQFIATGTYSDSSTQIITNAVTWDSSQKSIATIASGGLATSVAAGTTSISATLNGISGSTNLTVTAPVPSSVQITPVNPTFSLASVTTLQLTLIAIFTDIPNQNVTSGVTWEITSSSPSSIATVSSTGLVTATANTAGTVNIQATYLGKTATAIVTINP